jgi:FlgD Ig-like domain
MAQPLKTSFAFSIAVLRISLCVLASASPCGAQACVGCTPLDDAGGPPYLGVYPLGLYAGGTNSPPAAHLALAMSAAGAVVPRDASGNPDPNGLIGFVAIGMSNTNQEFATFERAEDTNLARNARLVILDTAVGGQSAEVIMDPTAPYWQVVGDRVLAAGLSPNQVQVAWLKEADGNLATTTFPAHAESLESHVRAIVQLLKDLYPGLRLCYFGSRIYGGYSSNPERNEPVSYETAFAYRDLIDAQVSGDPALNADPSAGPLEAPVLLWGPYLWANGTIARASDGLTWQVADYESDFIHPGPLGEAKVRALLSGFVTTNATATPWYLADTGADLVTIDASEDAYVDDQQPTTNFGNSIQLVWRYNSMRSYVLFDLSSVSDFVLHAKLSLKTPPGNGIAEGEVVVVTNASWDELVITAATAPPFDGAVLGTIPMASAGTAVSLDVTSAVQLALLAPPGTAKLAVGIRGTPGPAALQVVGSRQSLDPPRLVLTTGPSPTSVGAPDGRDVDAAASASAMRLSASPNPATRGARITLSLTRDLGAVVVAIHDASGARVRTLFEGAAPSGDRFFAWDGGDEHARLVPSGTYFIRAASEGGNAGPIAATRKFTFVHE